MKPILSKSQIILAALLLLPAPSFAHDWAHWHHDGNGPCLVDDKIEIGRTLDQTQKCQVMEQPELKSTTRFYPLLKDNPYPVRYWSAAVMKPITTTVHYTRYVTNRCTHEVVYQGPYEESFVNQIEFDLENPNMNDSDDVAQGGIDKTFELLPMAKADMEVAFQRLTKTCDEYKAQP